MPAPTTESPDTILARLAGAHAEHLAWLRHEFGSAFADEDLADILQEAYERATKSLNGGRPPAFSDDAHEVAWFRRVCNNTAVDAKRRRDGRRESERATRPTLVPLDPLAADDEHVGAALAALDEELETVGEDVVDPVATAIGEALRGLPEKHARILYWRYEDGLAAESIMRLEGLTTKQYEGRHTRAVKALGRALAALELGVGCGQARLIMRHHPEALLDAAGGATRIHVEECPACRAFRFKLRGALAVMPVSPAALGAKFALGTAVTTPTPTRSAVAVDTARGGLWKAAAGHPKVVAAITAGSLAVGGIGFTGAGSDGSGNAASHAQQRSAGSAGAVHGVLHHGAFGDHLAHDPLLGR